MAKNTEVTKVELIDALAGMATQYLENRNGDIECDYISASEDCIDVLTRLGIIKGNRIDYSLLRRDALDENYG